MGPWCLLGKGDLNQKKGELSIFAHPALAKDPVRLPLTGGLYTGSYYQIKHSMPSLPTMKDPGRYLHLVHRNLPGLLI